MATTTVVYSVKNPNSVARVKAMRAQHPKFKFVDVSDKEAIKEAESGLNLGNKIEYLDEPIKAKAKAPAKKKPAAKKK